MTIARRSTYRNTVQNSQLRRKVTSLATMLHKMPRLMVAEVPRNQGLTKKCTTSMLTKSYLLPCSILTMQNWRAESVALDK